MYFYIFEFILFVIIIILLYMFKIAVQEIFGLGIRCSSGSRSGLEDVAGFGGKRSESVFEFIECVENAFRKNCLAGKDAFEVIRPKFYGNAKHWLSYVESKVVSDWAKLRTELIGHYGTSSAFGVIRQLINLRFRPGEDFEAFVWRFRELYLKWRPDSCEIEIVLALVDQLPVSVSCLFVDVERLTLQEIILRYRRHGCSVEPSENRNRSSVVEAERDLSAEYRPGRQFIREERPHMFRGICYRCHQSGHIARNCSVRLNTNGSNDRAVTENH